MKITLQKIIANHGLCSRRQAEKLIKEGRVKINGEIAFLGQKANEQKDIIRINNRTLSSTPKKIYIKLNKPVSYTCTNRSFKGEKNIFQLINVPERLFVVGRLDKNSHGLIILTNDGDLNQKITHPKFQHQKVYEVKVKEKIRNIESINNKLKSGIDIKEGDGRVKVRDSRYLQNNIFIITLNEGKKRQIRRMFKALNLNVINLKRIKIANIELANLKTGQWTYLSKEEIDSLPIRK